MTTKKKPGRARLKQPSSYAGFAGIAQAIAFAFPQHAAIATAIGAIAAAVAVYLPEGVSGD